jgi:hypothetical protein
LLEDPNILALGDSSMGMKRLPGRFALEGRASGSGLLPLAADDPLFEVEDDSVEL